MVGLKFNHVSKMDPGYVNQWSGTRMVWRPLIQTTKRSCKIYCNYNDVSDSITLRNILDTTRLYIRAHWNNNFYISNWCVETCQYGRPNVWGANKA